MSLRAAGSPRRSLEASLLSPVETHEVVVIGGGPAGALTATRLAEHGRQVVLLEEHDTVGSPVHCTGLLGFDAFREFDLPRALVLGEAGSARFWGAARQSVRVESDHIRAAVVDRFALDTLLVDRARQAGVEIRRGWRAESVVVGPTAVRVQAGDRGTIEARAAVLACGANYRFHKQLDLGVPEVFLQSAQLETPFPEVADVEVRFGREVAPGGFAWLVPLSRGGAPYARMGLMSESRSRERFEAFARTLCDLAGVDVRQLQPPRLKMLPLSPVRKTYAERVLAVGDAAGLVKPTTGGGIYYGLHSGAIAAEVLDEALRRDNLSARYLRRYEGEWGKRFGREIRVGLAFRRVAARLSDESIDSLIELARVNGVVPLLQEHGSFNWHGKAALALLAHPAFRKIVFQSWRDGVDLL